MERPRRSRRRRLLYWLLIDAVVAVTVLVLLLYKPSRYHPLVSAGTADPNSGHVDEYLSHHLIPTLYNGAQSQQPFEMSVLDKGLNEAIARAKWPQESGGITFSAPEVLFAPGRVVLMGTADIEGVKFVLTVELGPRLDSAGRLNLLVEKVKIGAMNITPLAKMTARKMYRERLETGLIDTEDIRTKIAASLLNEEPFEPVFLVEDKWVRLKSFEIAPGKLVAQLVPAKAHH